MPRMNDGVPLPAPSFARMAWGVLGASLAVAGAIGILIGVVLGLAIRPDELYRHGGWELAPTAVLLMLGMAVVVAVVAVLALAIAQMPPRSRRREAVAVTIGAPIGALIAPVAFYPAVPLFGLGVAAVLAAAAILGYRALLARAWRRASPAVMPSSPTPS